MYNMIFAVESTSNLESKGAGNHLLFAPERIYAIPRVKIEHRQFLGVKVDQ